MTGREPGADRPDDESWVPDDLDALVVPDDLSGLVDPVGRPFDAPADRPDTTEPVQGPVRGPAPVPDDPSGLDEPVTVALLLTQVVAAEPLAAVCCLAGVQAEAVGSAAGSVAVLTDPTAAAEAAAAVSRMLPGTRVVLLERRDGSIAAAVWSRGVRGEEAPPGLVLAEGPALLEDLLLGSTTLDDLEGTVPSAGMSRFKALRLLSKAARQARGR
ncbi:MAG: hypothetical protein FWH11_12685 [Micrococcales bacterium]|nr:hypothetical protein [Micrococcales bacterium]